MRNELYADSRDELKWTVATRNAQMRNQAIRWVTMYRPNINRHGNGVELVPNSSLVVTQFFEQERQAFQAGFLPDLRRIIPLGQQLGIEIEMNLQEYPQSINARLRYIEAELHFLRNRVENRNHFVLIDPDNGIGRSHNDGKQFHEDHVPLIWNNLREEDTLGIVQFQYREADWVNQRRQNLVRLLGLQEEQVSSDSWNNVCIFTIH